MWWVIYSLALTANKIFSRSRGALGYDRLCSAVCQILDPPTSAHQSQPPNTERERDPHNDQKFESKHSHHSAP